MSFDDELVGEFVVEANEHLAGVESQFLAIEEAGANVDVALVNEVFRAVHSIKGAAGFLGLVKINDLAHSLENVLNKMRNLELAPNSEIIEVMLRAADKLQSLIHDIHNSNEVDVSEHVVALEAIAQGQTPEPTDETPEEGEEAIGNAIGDENILPPLHATAAEPVAETAVSAAMPLPVGTTPATSDPASTVDGGQKQPAVASPASHEANIRVSVGLLDKLMNLAGELVLSRNQLMQVLNADDHGALETIAARLDQVTSEVQESIMQTRMQQIGTVFSRFTRVVRDLSSKLGKECDLTIEGKEVEVDKTIIEAIGDPLTHLVRNSIDHGIEMPAERVTRGKPAHGSMNIHASYQAGKVRIEINDDGAGIDPARLREKAVSKGIITAEQAEQMNDREAIRLIFHAGFSMAAKVTDVSGRGVGMDVVRTNIAKLGGAVDVESIIGKGTSVIITLPLTLAIIPSLIVQSGEDRFAIPQVNILELVRVRPEEFSKRLGRVKDAEVLRLRGTLLPLLRLRTALDLDPKSEDKGTRPEPKASAATNIIVVESGQQRFGIVVDGLHDSEEIVVKPLGRHLKDARCLSGATILGDGHVALILDVAGIAAHQQIRSSDDMTDAAKAEEHHFGDEEVQTVLLFSNHPQEYFAVPMDIVGRIERIRTDQIDAVGGQELVQYRNSSMPLLRLENIITAKPLEPEKWIYVIVFSAGGKEIGLAAPGLEDIRNVPTSVDTVTFQEPGVIGSLVLSQRTTRLLDLFVLAEVAHPEWFAAQPQATAEKEGGPPVILLAEDSAFFRHQVKTMIEGRGYVVVDCEDGLLAWEHLATEGAAVDLVVTDIEMPNMNGFELCQRIKESPLWGHLPVIALTSLAGAADMQRGLEVGIDDYQIKMDREKLLNSLSNFVRDEAGATRRHLQPA